MQTNPITPLFTTTKLDQTATFYREHLGFAPQVELPGYVELVQGEGGPRLAFMEPCPDGKHPLGQGAGLVYCFVVEDADAEHARLVREGVTIREVPEDRPWGERSFVALDPNGISLYFGHPIATKVEMGSAAE